jgi:hypothetical protein
MTKLGIISFGLQIADSIFLPLNVTSIIYIYIKRNKFTLSSNKIFFTRPKLIEALFTSRMQHN